MARPSVWPPPLKRFPKRPYARFSWKGKWHHCGFWDVESNRPTPEAKAEYQRMLALLQSSPETPVVRQGEMLVMELWVAWKAAVVKDDRRDEVFRCGKLLAELHLTTTLPKFKSPDLSSWRDWLCGMTNPDGTKRFGRYSVSRFMRLVQECFRWGVEKGFVGYDQYAALKLVSQPAKGTVREPKMRTFVEWEELAWVSDTGHRSDAGDILKLLWWTGARPSEVLTLTAADIQRTGFVRTLKGMRVDLEPTGVWAVPLLQHKTAKDGKDRCLFLGPEARKLIEPRLNRVGTLFGKRTGEPYTPLMLNRLIQVRLERNDKRRWPVYAIRHSCAERVQNHPDFGYEAAQAYLGHSPKGVTATYAGVQWALAARVAAALG
jgi:integrase